MPHSNKIFANKVFDRQLVAKRRAQALARENYPDFLDELIGQELVSRLDLIERQFENCVILGQPANRFLQEIRRSPKLHNIIAQRSGSGGRSELEIGRAHV